MSKTEIKNPMRQLSLSHQLADSVKTTTQCWVPDDANLNVGNYIYLKNDEKRWKVEQIAHSVVALDQVPKGSRVGEIE